MRAKGRLRARSPGVGCCGGGDRGCDRRAASGRVRLSRLPAATCHLAPNSRCSPPLDPGRTSCSDALRPGARVRRLRWQSQGLVRWLLAAVVLACSPTTLFAAATVSGPEARLNSDNDADDGRSHPEVISRHRRGWRRPSFYYEALIGSIEFRSIPHPTSPLASALSPRPHPLRRLHPPPLQMFLDRARVEHLGQ